MASSTPYEELLSVLGIPAHHENRCIATATRSNSLCRNGAKSGWKKAKPKLTRLAKSNPAQKSARLVREAVDKLCCSQPKHQEQKTRICREWTEKLTTSRFVRQPSTPGPAATTTQSTPPEPSSEAPPQTEGGPSGPGTPPTTPPSHPPHDCHMCDGRDCPRHRAAPCDCEHPRRPERSQQVSLDSVALEALNQIINLLQALPPTLIQGLANSGSAHTRNQSDLNARLGGSGESTAIAG